MAQTFDPNFSVDKVIFQAEDFVKVVKEAEKGTWTIFDEPGLGLSHRTWWNQWNRVTTQLIQSSRFLQVNYLFTLPQSILMDIDARRVAHFMAILRRRGYASLYRIQPNYFGGSPDVFTPKLGAVETGLPSKELARAYEEKRAKFHDQFFDKYLKAPEEKPAEPDLAQVIRKNAHEYIDASGKINAKKIVARHRVSFATAYKVKAIVEGQGEE